LDAILDFLNALTDVRYAGQGGGIPAIR